jgi:hypothetical protein
MIPSGFERRGWGVWGFVALVLERRLLSRKLGLVVIHELKGYAGRRPWEIEVAEQVV